MSPNGSKQSSPMPPVCSAEGLDERIQYSLLDMPFLDLQFLDANPLGISLDGDFGSIPGCCPPTFSLEASAPAEMPLRPLLHTNTFPPQPLFHLHEPTPITPQAPPKLFTQVPVDQLHANQAETWSPCSLISASSPPSSKQHSRAQSISGPASHPYTPQHTPQLTPGHMPKMDMLTMDTPRQDVLTSSPQMLASWTPGHTPSPQPHLSPQPHISPQPHMSPQPYFYPPIAPHPASMASMKRSFDETDYDTPLSRKRSRTMPSSPQPNAEITSEDRLLLKLRDQDGLSWKDIVAKFSEDLNKDYQPAALQMRIKRLRDRLRVWTDGDVQALRLAHQYWTETKFDIIASKMLDFGSTEKWSAKQCRQKWVEICSSSEFVSGPAYSSTLCGTPPTYLS